MQQPEPASPLDLIAGSAAHAQQAVDNKPNGLGDRLEKLELALEQIALSAKYQTELSEYISDLRHEARSIQTARKIVGGFSIIASAVLFISPVWIAVREYPWFHALPPYVAAALLIGQLAAGVLLLSTISKSVFRSAAERQGDEFIPPQLKLIHDMLNGGK